MKLSKNKKIITSLIGTGVILGTSIGIAIPLLESKEEEKNNDEPKIIISIKQKIQNKDLIIPKNIRTSNDSEILLAIKNQLKIDNPTLTDEDLSKITDNIWTLKTGKKTPVVLKIKLENGSDFVNLTVTKEKNIKLWTKNSAIVTNSNITSGEHAFSSIIQDSSGNLWSMGFASNSKLQVLKRDETQWKNDTSSGLTKGSNIKNGSMGVIFEDDSGNIWSMGYSSKLQVLVKNKDGTFADSWVNNNHPNTGNKLLKNSAIKFGMGGTIFQDSFGNLWAIGGWYSKLQVLVKNKDSTYADSWICDNRNGLLKNSNINNIGDNQYQWKYGVIFQDSFGNLWSIGKNSKLQVLKADPNSSTGYVDTGWVNNNHKNNGDALLKNSNIVLGSYGTIFQDSFGNLWASGLGQRNFQVLKAKLDGSGYVDAGWTCDNTKGLLKGSNIIVDKKTQSPTRRIFQDSFGNLWVQGVGRKPQVLKAKPDGSGYVNTGWINNNDPSSGDKLLKNLKIADKNGWFFFQDSFGNLWSFGVRAKLQVLKVNQTGDGYVNTGWINDNDKNIGDELLKDSKINGSFNGKIFEDSSKNLWVMGFGSKLQVYDKTLKKWKS